MFRKIALDIGSKSCGIAISDPLNITSQGIANLKFNEYDWTTMLVMLEQYFNEYKIDKIIIGYPTYFSGEKSKTTSMIEYVSKLIENKFKLPIIFIDENFSTKKSNDILISANVSRVKRKNLKDKLSAQIILEDYFLFYN